MKLLLLVTLALGVVAVVEVSGEQIDHKDFVVVKNESHPQDIDHNKVQQHEQQNRPQTMKRRIPLNAADTLRSTVEPKHLPHAFNVSLQRNTPLFDDNNGTNRLHSSPRSARQFQTSLYHCDHSTYLLTWFPYLLDLDIHMCYIPWASAQAITYAHCGMDCDAPNGNKGHCRPGCFHRRVVIALCVNPNIFIGFWEWRILEVNLPQACLCTGCQHCG